MHLHGNKVFALVQQPQGIRQRNDKASFFLDTLHVFVRQRVRSRT